MNTTIIPFAGMVTIERDEGAYTARWRVHGNKLIVNWDDDEEPAQLGMFEKEPEALARMLLTELLDRKLGKQRKGNAVGEIPDTYTARIATHASGYKMTRRHCRPSYLRDGLSLGLGLNRRKYQTIGRSCFYLH
jgi:hypothetical protein